MHLYRLFTFLTPHNKRALVAEVIMIISTCIAIVFLGKMEAQAFAGKVSPVVAITFFGSILGGLIAAIAFYFYNAIPEKQYSETETLAKYYETEHPKQASKPTVVTANQPDDTPTQSPQ